MPEKQKMPDRGKIISANFGNYATWKEQAKAFYDSLMGEDFRHTLRYSGALVADLHQILHYGGIYLYPADDHWKNGKLRLMYECAPLAMIAKQAGGGATTGAEHVMDIYTDDFHQRIPFAIGGRYEIQKYDVIYGRVEKS